MSSQHRAIWLPRLVRFAKEKNIQGGSGIDDWCVVLVCLRSLRLLPVLWLVLMCISAQQQQPQQQNKHAHPTNKHPFQH